MLFISSRPQCVNLVQYCGISGILANTFPRIGILNIPGETAEMNATGPDWLEVYIGWVMVWFRQATSHYLIQGWHRSTPHMESLGYNEGLYPQTSNLSCTSVGYI